MKKLVLIIAFFSIHCAFSQTEYEFTKIEESETSTLQDQQYSKDLNYEKDRSFNEDLKTKYSEKEFNYNDDIKATNPDDKKIDPEINTETSNTNWSFLGMSVRFIILLILAIIFIVFLLSHLDFTFVKMSKYRERRDSIELLSEEENIDENDYERLLAKAVRDKNFRLATRYYYLSLLKKLSHKEYIEYHKDKTNSDYLFELKDNNVRSNFSYLSYIYSYVWYGEFPVDELKFGTIEKKYQSFINTIK